MSTTNQKVSAIQSREIRVFLSSTFRDMEAERNHLVKQVFPKVRAACLARQVGFTEIDLRWGVTEEESKNGATVEICLKEIERCRNFPPFFIGFLGERYGWIPKHEDLTAYWQKHKGSSYAKPILNAVKRGISVTELEMELAVLEEGAAEKIASHALFLLRDRTLTDSLYRQETGKAPNPADPAFYDPAAGKLDTLKERIRQTPFLGIDGYTSVEQFGEAVETYLLEQLDRHFPEDAVPTPLERQRLAHEAFRYHRLQNFLPREDVRKQVIKALQKRLDAPHLGPVLLAGPSGQGKSALMADLARHLETTHPEWIVLDHYIGADDTNSLESWARRILETLHLRIDDLVDAVPETPKDQKEALSTWIAMACRRQEQNTGKEAGSTRLILILDALDQCRDGGKDLELLKSEILGPDAIVVVSAADDTPAREAAKDYETQVVPPLTAKLKVRMIRDTLARYRKKLTPDLAQRLAEAPQSGSPLFLSLALEELRLDASHEGLAELVSDILKAKDAEQLFLNNFLLDADYGRPELPTLAAAFMALLGASHAGLSENELADLLALPTDPKAKDTKKPRLPQIHLSRILANLQPFLLNKAGRRAPMHRIFGRAALDYYGTVPVREHLYRHFKKGYGRGRDKFGAGGAAEALYQITQLAITGYGNKGGAKKRLEADMGTLSIPVKLHDIQEDIVLDALKYFSYDEKMALAERWRPQVEPLVMQAVDEAARQIGSFAEWLRERVGHSPAARALDEPLVEVCCSALGEDHPHTLNARGNLANTLYALGNFLRARTMGELVVEARRRILGVEHPASLMAVHNLAETLSAQGDLSGAIAMQESVVVSCRHSLGEHHPSTLTAMNNLASMLRHQGEQPRARTMRDLVLAGRRRILGEKHPSTIVAMGNLAVSLHDQGDISGARAMMESTLEARRHILGDDHPSTLAAMGNLAAVLHSLGESLEAGRLQELLLEACRRILGVEHPDTLGAMYNLASMLAAQGDLQRAKAMNELVLNASIRSLGAEHPNTFMAMQNLASILRDCGDLPGTRSLQQMLLEARRRTQGEKHPDTLAAMGNLAITCWSMEDFEATRVLEAEILTIKRRLLGTESHEALAAMKSLATTLDRLDRNEEADALRADAQVIRRHVAERERPEGVAMLDRLVSVVREWMMKDGAAVPQFNYGEAFDLASFRLTVHGSDGDEQACYVDIHSEPPGMSVYLYAPMPVPEARREEVDTLLERFNADGEDGVLQLIDDYHQLCFEVSSDIQNGALVGKMVAERIAYAVSRINDAIPKVRRLLQS